MIASFLGVCKYVCLYLDFYKAHLRNFYLRGMLRPTLMSVFTCQWCHMTDHFLVKHTKKKVSTITYFNIG